MARVLGPASRVDLIWGIKPTFVRYLMSIPDLRTETGQGAERFTDRATWRFPGIAAAVDSDPWDGGSARFYFGGELRITGHGGVLDVCLARLRIEFEGGRAALSIADSGLNNDSSRLVVGIAVVDPARRRGDGSAALDLDLHSDAVDLFNRVYAAGTPLAPAVLLPV